MLEQQSANKYKRVFISLYVKLLQIYDHSLFPFEKFGNKTKKIQKMY